MLSAKTIDTVKATAPIIADQAEALTRHFYKRMFTHNPEVIPYFNQAHQREGRQQKALAAAICAYAANIDRLEMLGSAVELIAQKHASLQVKPEHYPIVGENLLASIREVLGTLASDEVINAWSEAYGFLAGILTSREGQIYDQQLQAPGGWADFKTFRVIRKERESEVITSFYLISSDGTQLPRFKAGQYITLRVPTRDGKFTTMRNYSLSDQPGKPWFRISVKREDGLAPQDPVGYVSHYLHSAVEVGSTVEVAAPCGEFILDPKADNSVPLVFLSAGVGITPIYSMLATALAEKADREVTLVHAVRNQQVQAFRESMETLAGQHLNLRLYYRYSEARSKLEKSEGRSSAGLVDGRFLDSLNLNAAAEYYICGPEVFIAGVQSELLKRGVASENIHFEFFGPRI